MDKKLLGNYLVELQMVYHFIVIACGLPLFTLGIIPVINLLIWVYYHTKGYSPLQKEGNESFNKAWGALTGLNMIPQIILLILYFCNVYDSWVLLCIPISYSIVMFFLAYIIFVLYSGKKGLLNLIIHQFKKLFFFFAVRIKKR